MTTIDKTYCSKCKSTDSKLTPYSKREDKNGNIVRYMYCHSCCRERQKQNYHNDKQRYRQYAYDSIARHKEKHRVRNKVAQALKSGLLIKPLHCEKCGEVPIKIEAHHEDYSKPLEVVWLCTACHNKV